VHQNTLQHAATRCNTLQHAATPQCNTLPLRQYAPHVCTTTHCSEVQRTAAHCSILRTTTLAVRAMRHMSTLQHAATHCNTCGSLKPTQDYIIQIFQKGQEESGRRANGITQIDTLQHTATHCNTRISEREESKRDNKNRQDTNPSE